MKIRIATLDDLPALVDIYNQAILSGQKTADITPFSIEERKEWFKKHDPDKHPILVAIYDDIIVGYLTFSPYRTGRMALRNTAEVSFYVHFDYHDRGVGSNLMENAIDMCSALQIKTLFAILIESNKTSIKFLEKYEFEKWGHLPKVAEFDGIEYGQFYYGLRLSESEEL